VLVDGSGCAGLRFCDGSAPVGGRWLLAACGESDFVEHRSFKRMKFFVTFSRVAPLKV
jgi:hypothetical protein